MSTFRFTGRCQLDGLPAVLPPFNTQTLATICFRPPQIVEQVVSAKRFLESVDDPCKVTGVVFMGMGEPFDNYDK